MSGGTPAVTRDPVRPPASAAAVGAAAHVHVVLGLVVGAGWLCGGALASVRATCRAWCASCSADHLWRRQFACLWGWGSAHPMPPRCLELVASLLAAADAVSVDAERALSSTRHDRASAAQLARHICEQVIPTFRPQPSFSRAKPEMQAGPHIHKADWVSRHRAVFVEGQQRRRRRPPAPLGTRASSDSAAARSSSGGGGSSRHTRWEVAGRRPLKLRFRWGPWAQAYRALMFLCPRAASCDAVRVRVARFLALQHALPSLAPPMFTTVPRLEFSLGAHHGAYEPDLFLRAVFRDVAGGGGDDGDGDGERHSTTGDNDDDDGGGGGDAVDGGVVRARGGGGGGGGGRDSARPPWWPTGTLLEVLFNDTDRNNATMFPRTPLRTPELFSPHTNAAGRRAAAAGNDAAAAATLGMALVGAVPPPPPTRSFRMHVQIPWTFDAAIFRSAGGATTGGCHSRRGGGGGDRCNDHDSAGTSASSATTTASTALAAHPGLAFLARLSDRVLAHPWALDPQHVSVMHCLEEVRRGVAVLLEAELNAATARLAAAVPPAYAAARLQRLCAYQADQEHAGQRQQSGRSGGGGDGGSGGSGGGCGGGSGGSSGGDSDGGGGGDSDGSGGGSGGGDSDGSGGGSGGGRGGASPRAATSTAAGSGASLAGQPAGATGRQRHQQRVRSQLGSPPRRAWAWPRPVYGLPCRPGRGWRNHPDGEVPDELFHASDPALRPRDFPTAPPTAAAAPLPSPGSRRPAPAPTQNGAATAAAGGGARVAINAAASVVVAAGTAAAERGVAYLRPTPRPMGPRRGCGRRGGGGPGRISNASRLLRRSLSLLLLGEARRRWPRRQEDCYEWVLHAQWRLRPYWAPASALSSANPMRDMWPLSVLVRALRLVQVLERLVAAAGRCCSGAASPKPKDAGCAWAPAADAAAGTVLATMTRRDGRSGGVGGTGGLSRRLAEKFGVCQETAAAFLELLW